MKKILLIRTSSIGDIVLTTPVVRAIKQQTDYELHVLTKKQYSGIYHANSHVDKVHSFSKNITECLTGLKNEKFDIIIDLQKNLRSYQLKRKLKIKSYSFPKLNIEKWLLVNLNINKLPDEHIVDRYFKAVESLGITNDGKGLEYFIPSRDEVVPENIDPRLKDGYISFVIGGRHQTKILPSEKAALIIAKIKMPVVLLGGTDDKERGEEILKLAPNSDIFNTCGALSINQSASVVKQSDVIITNDTGLMHIAAALNKPIVSIWGNTVPEFGMYPYMPENMSSYFISEVEGLRCRPCSKLGYQKCPKKHFKCMMDQDVDAIKESVKKFL
ncbi:MAG: glycosyltransferase family 9 protein [Bacteroidetes bacterium]|nr:glycosyltransferase family 9 protein [Bacteroidota bacterium]MBL6943200.1 glycosyltransferase family 9 protein [Bacteroidales bacterium]